MDTTTLQSVTTSKLQQQSIITTIAFYAYITLSSLGLIGNAFVCLVMLRYRKFFHSTTNKLIIHQSFVDFLASLVFLLRHLLVISSPAAVPDNILGSLYCKLWWSEWPQYGMFVTSTYNLVAISLERYFATCQPVRYRNMFQTHHLKLGMVAAWLCGWLSQIHLFALSNRIDDKCNLTRHGSAVQVIEGVAVSLVEFIIPIVVIIFAYSKIILELRKRSRARIGDHNHDAQNMLSKANKNVTKTLLVVAIFFAVCWIPKDVNYILFSLGLNENFVNSTVFEIVGAIVVVNMCINPFIYCFTYEHFQKQVKRMVFGGCRSNANRVGTTDVSARHNHTVHSAHDNITISVIGHRMKTNV